MFLATPVADVPARMPTAFFPASICSIRLPAVMPIPSSLALIRRSQTTRLSPTLSGQSIRSIRVSQLERVSQSVATRRIATTAETHGKYWDSASLFGNDDFGRANIFRYLNTFAAAEQLYDAVFQWKQASTLSITSTSLAFFKDVYPSAAVGTYASSTSTFNSIVSAVSAYADSYMSVAVSQKDLGPS